MKANIRNFGAIIIILLSLSGCSGGGNECDKLSKFVCYDNKFGELMDSKYIKKNVGRLPTTSGTESVGEHDDLISCEWTKSMVKESHTTIPSDRIMFNEICDSTNERLHRKLQLMQNR